MGSRQSARLGLPAQGLTAVLFAAGCGSSDNESSTAGTATARKAPTGPDASG